MPIIRMYPPSGMALMPYSVSPLRREKIVGPNPTMYCGTRIPKSFAVDRCPNSCHAMENSRPNAKTRMPRTVNKIVMREPPLRVPGPGRVPRSPLPGRPGP